MQDLAIFWFRQDLRLHDNQALIAAAKHRLCMPIYILQPGGGGDFALGAASKWWLHHSLCQLNQALENKLNVYIGDPSKIIADIVKKMRPAAVYWNRCYEPWRISEDADIKASMRQQGIVCKSFKASLLWEPWEVLKPDGKPYQVFTPFYKNGCLRQPSPRAPLPLPAKLSLLQDPHNKLTIAQLKLLPKIQWDKTMAIEWQIGEQAAANKLAHFLSDGLASYQEGRNFPAQRHVSRLSPHLHFGEISPQQIWHATKQHTLGQDGDLEAAAESFLRELCWREFSYALLYHYPNLPQQNFKAKFDNFPWQHNPALLAAWQRGQTGYPLIDAGMRELWQTGYMHGRVRMAVGSFLVKNLRLHWRHGAAWFWNCLLDADLANNSASWQWVAGSGADAAPYFRIFNPVLQGEKFDPSGEYTKRYVPELAFLPQRYLLQPWNAPKEVLDAANVRLGVTYPLPIVDLKLSRQQAMQAYNDAVR